MCGGRAVATRALKLASLMLRRALLPQSPQCGRGAFSADHATQGSGYAQACPVAPDYFQRFTMTKQSSTSLRYVEKGDHARIVRIVGVETVDHAPDGQLAAHAKSYFKRVGRWG